MDNGREFPAKASRTPNVRINTFSDMKKIVIEDENVGTGAYPESFRLEGTVHGQPSYSL
jgi:hypothetical protein